MEETIKILTEAITTRKPVEFEYEREGHPPGKRILNPHVLFRGVGPDFLEKVYLHGVQTAGVSSTLINYPDWRMFFVDKMTQVQILLEEPVFLIDPRYNPNYAPYQDSLAKI